MADVDMGVTETSASGAALVAAMVQSQLIAQARVMFTIQDESARASKGAKSISFPKTGGLTPVAKVENVATESQALTYAVDTLTLNQHFHTLVRLEDKADAQSVVNIESDIIERAASGMALQMDTYAYGVIRDGASSSSPDHVLGHYASAGTITRTKILEARKLLNIQNVPQEGRVMLIGPLQEAQLLDIAGFVEADKYGSTTALLNGEIGRLFGFTVVMTTVCEDDVTLYYHRNCAVFARQIEPKWEQDRNLSKLANEYSLSCLYGAKILDSGKRNVTANAT